MPKDPQLRRTSGGPSTSSCTSRYFYRSLSRALCTQQSDWPLHIFFVYEISLTIRSRRYLVSAYLYITFTVYFLPICVCSRGTVLWIQAKAPSSDLPFFFIFFLFFFRIFIAEPSQRAFVSVKRMFSSESFLLDDMMLITREALQHWNRKNARVWLLE